ncbi:unnamed protein product [Cuscuta campestris]|uniref:Endonuclease/exonuclease/phosphatase domain-containing protein n=1 Tax=Cuscuta campestris TaxID=132261 RepID=A0A484ML42_9ASTE|nr:unnamed protein product [Cuscuta campestris]
MEPKTTAKKLTHFQLTLGFSHSRSSMDNRVWVMWKEDNLIYQHHQEMDQAINIYFTYHNNPITITTVYGKYSVTDRQRLWDYITATSLSMHNPWVIGGDFNCISSVDHHKGTNTPCLRSIHDFDKCIMDASLISPMATGSTFTWTGVRSLGRIWRRIDRVFHSNHTLNSFQEISCSHLPRSTSNHNPLLIKLSNPHFTGPKPFRYINYWSTHNSFLSTVSNSWGPYTRGGMRGLGYKLKNLGFTLQTWNKNTFGNIFTRVSLLEGELKVIEEQFDTHPTPEMRSLMQETKAKLIIATQQEYSYWKQKANIKWTKEGDANTAFFHSTVKIRRSQQKINSLKSKDGK